MTFSTLDPRTGLVSGSYQYDMPEDISKKITLLHLNFGKWKYLLPQHRQRMLLPSLEKMKKLREELIFIISQEMGKSHKEAVLEVSKCIRAVEQLLSQDLSFLNSCEVNSVYGVSQIQHEPLGVIYSVMPWNFPLWQAVRMVYPTLLAGNTILLKHSEITPRVGSKIEEIFKFDDETCLLLNTYARHEETENVLANPLVGGVSLTGSVAAGKTVYSLAAKYFKKAVLELGGSDPYVVTANADISLAAKKIAKSRLLNNGQTCISAKRCIVDKRILRNFLDHLKKEFEKYQIGEPSDKNTDLGPLAHPRFKAQLHNQINELVNNTGAEKVYSKPHRQDEKSAFFNAEIYLLPQNNSWLKNQEFFGPIMLVIPYSDIEQAAEIANSTDFALGAAVFTKDKAEAELLMSRILAGQIVWNDAVTSDLPLPFGGFKNSGIGRELGQEGFFEFTQTKVISRT